MPKTTSTANFPEVLINVEEVPTIPSYILDNYLDAPVLYIGEGPSQEEHATDTDLSTLQIVNTVCKYDAHSQAIEHESPKKDTVAVTLSTDSGYSEDLTRDSRPASVCSLKSALKKTPSAEHSLNASSRLSREVRFSISKPTAIPIPMDNIQRKKTKKSKLLPMLFFAIFILLLFAFLTVIFLQKYHKH